MKPTPSRCTAPLRRQTPGLLAGLVTAALLGTATGPATALEPADPALPRLPAASGPAVPANGWQLPNPYRGKDALLGAGAVAYARHCASCHGEGGENAVAEGPDLRRLNSACKRLRDTSLEPRCLQDVDTYYLQSVLEGKLRAGLMHMPAWAGVLPQETIWAIRSFTETRPLPPPRTLPDLPPVGKPSQ